MKSICQIWRILVKNMHTLVNEIQLDHYLCHYKTDFALCHLLMGNGLKFDADRTDCIREYILLNAK